MGSGDDCLDENVAPEATRLELARLYHQLQVAQGLLVEGSVDAGNWQEASRLLERVDEALGTLVLETDNPALASRLSVLRSMLSGHLRAAATLVEVVTVSSHAGVEALRRAAEKATAGLEPMVPADRAAT